jgi:predicted ABC-class ATPase
MQGTNCAIDKTGSYDCGFFTLFVDHIQSDPFAPPSHFRAQIPHTAAQFPPETYATTIRAVALADFLTRVFYRHVHEHR